VLSIANSLPSTNLHPPPPIRTALKQGMVPTVGLLVISLVYIVHIIHASPVYSNQNRNRPSSFTYQPPQYECPANESYAECGRECEPLCTALHKLRLECEQPCMAAACKCQKGYARRNDGRCVRILDCPSKTCFEQKLKFTGARHNIHFCRRAGMSATFELQRMSTGRALLRTVMYASNGTLPALLSKCMWSTTLRL
jgi:hypothetical protein